MPDIVSLLREGASGFSCEVTEPVARQFVLYLRLLQEWNEKMNLTSITEDKEIVVKHFLDSLSLAPYMGNDGEESLIDLGTGAGFPGVPLKLVFPDLKLTLLDATAKKVDFLKMLCDALGVKAECVHARAEEIGHDPAHREQYTHATSRAVAELTPLCEYALPLLKTGGVFLAMKGREIEAEVESAAYAAETLGGSTPEIVPVTIPYSEMKRSIILIHKVRETPREYPRKPGIPLKKPLQKKPH